jgi:hypothetical protein
MGRTACTEPQCLYKGALYVVYETNILVCQDSLPDSLTKRLLLLKHEPNYAIQYINIT